MQDNILPGRGLGELIFGMTRSDVKKLLGEADEIEAGEENDDLEYWHYDDLEISLVFDATEHNKLSTIVCANQTMTLYGEKLADMSKDNLVGLLKRKGHKALTFTEDFDEDVHLETIEADDIEMLFWLREGGLTEVQFGPFFVDEGTISWP